MSHDPLFPMGMPPPNVHGLGPDRAVIDATKYPGGLKHPGGLLNQGDFRQPYNATVMRPIVQAPPPRRVETVERCPHCDIQLKVIPCVGTQCNRCGYARGLVSAR